MRFSIFSIPLIFIATIICCSKKPAEQSHPLEYKTYSEQHRPQFHFSPKEKWMNDPNGMVYYNNEYHLFYQYYPDSTVWGPMHWGHAVSKDMIYWEHLPVALYPDSIGMIFSGSAVVDRNNSSGLGLNGQPPLIAIFTYHDMEAEKAGHIDYQTQGLAYSNDNGRTWTKYAGNPVLKNPGIKDFRDPKVSWYEADQKWIMTLAVHDHVSFYSSKDLLHWTKESDFGFDIGSHEGVWECPDLFRLRCRNEDTVKWVLLLSINPGGPNGGSATQYFVGNFDGKSFTNDNSAAPVWLDAGRDNYAGVTWSDIPENDGRRLFLGWMSNWMYAMQVPTDKWRSAMTIPRELTLFHTIEGYRLFSYPVVELEKLRSSAFSLDSQTFIGHLDLTSKLGFSPQQMEVNLEFESPDSLADYGIELSNSKGEIYRVGYSGSKKGYYSDRSLAGKSDFNDSFAGKVIIVPGMMNVNTKSLRLFIDVASAELFAEGGSVVMTEIFFPNENYNRVQLYTMNGPVKIKKATFYSIRSIWNESEE